LNNSIPSIAPESPPPVILDWIRSASFVRQVEWHDTIASTNDRGNELAANPELETPLLIIAGQQTAGRGRGTNQWWSAAGALTFTLVFDPERDLVDSGLRPLALEYWPRVALVAGVSLCDILQNAMPTAACHLKWPNDVLLEGKKVAGILADVPPTVPEGPRRLVLGVGVNVNNSLSAAPAEIQAVATAMCDTADAPFDSTQLLVDWLNVFMNRLDLLAILDTSLIERWQSLCALRGKTIELQSGGRSVRGACRGIDADGALLLDTPAGMEKLYAGALVRVV
jgi:BirA family biotin operon repressor/biotin-[acetyl-CoA-carboxylase] ligase